MWITKQRATTGPVFGSADNFEGLGIFFDTYKNNRPGVSFPYVMAMMGDGNTPYDQAHDGKANEIGGCQVRAKFPSIRENQISSIIFPTLVNCCHFGTRLVLFATPLSQPRLASHTSKTNPSRSNFSTRLTIAGLNASL